MAEPVIATETVVVHDDAMGIDRRVIAGVAVPPDLVEAYEEKTGNKGSSKRASAKADGEKGGGA